jgi:hypothetical protein
MRANEILYEIGYRSNKNYVRMDDYDNYEIYIGKKLFKGKFIAVAVHPRTKKSIKIGDQNKAIAVDKLHAELDNLHTDLEKVHGHANIDFNVIFAKQMLKHTEDEFYAKIIPGPKLVIAGNEILELPELLKDEGFKKSHIRNKNKQGYPLPVIPLSKANAEKANLVANGRYIIKDPINDNDNNLVYDLEFDSTVYDKNERVFLGKPGLTVATLRQ